MCGITGFYIQEQSNHLLDALDTSVNNLKKRGPNASGKYISDSFRVALGHSRLSIIDTSEAANQPMHSLDNKYTLVFNGEIFNYKSLRKELVSKGYEFRTNSDTEVVLNLFHAYQNEAWIKLNGFFAIAIYDHSNQTISLARDRFGIKPLLYSYYNNTLFFGSEMKALLPFGINKDIDEDALRMYFSLNYIPAPHSIFSSVKKMMPGQYLIFDGNKLEQKYYYKLEPKIESKLISYQNAQKELYKLMEQSVADRLVADVPLGTFLSGGIDSSVITALASKQVNSISTFSVGFKDNSFFDERTYARLVAEKYKTNHHEIELSNDDLLLSLEELLEYSDEPFADSSALAVNALCKETKKHVTVCLSGDGADEVFAGYNKYMAEYKLQNMGKNEQIISYLAPIWNFLPKSRNTSITNTIRKLHKFAEGSSLNKKERYWDWCCVGKKSLVDALLLQKSKNSFEDKRQELIAKINSEKGINDVLLNDISLVLPNDMLTKVDSMSMRNGLEVRVPFLDYRVVEFACSLSEDFKINSTLKKRIVQDTFRKILPEKIYNRPKHGFEVPMLNWLRKELNNKLTNVYLEPTFVIEQKIFNLDTINLLLKKLHSNNPEDSHATVWALLVFQHWYIKTFFK